MTAGNRHAPRGRIKGDDPLQGEDLIQDGWRGCFATSKTTGNRCKAPAILGAKVCRMHGGSAPQVREAAKKRIERLAEGPALECLEELINPQMRKQFPSTALGASRYLVDRQYGTPTESVDMNISGQIDIVQVLRQRHARAQKAPPNDPLPQAGAHVSGH